MALFPCPACSHQISDRAKACPHCGHPLQRAAETSAPSSIWRTIGGCLLFIALVAVVVILGTVAKWESTLDAKKNEAEQPSATQQHNLEFEEKVTALTTEKKWRELTEHLSQRIGLDLNGPNPETRKWRSLRARAYQSEQNWQKAIDDYSLNIMQDPTPEDLLGRGYCRLSLGQFAEAVVDLTRSIERDSSQPISYEVRSIANGQMRQFEAAIADLDAAIKLNPRVLRYFRQKAEWQRTIGEYDKALETCSEALLHNPNSTDILRLRSEIYLFSGDYEKGLAELATVIQVEPNSESYAARAVIYLQLGESEKAIKDLDKAVELSPNATAFLIIRAGLHCDFGNTSQALLDASEAIRLDPNLGDAYTIRGYTRFLTDNKRELAVEDCNKGVALAPESVVAHFYRARLFLVLQEDENAVTDLSTVMTLGIKQTLTGDKSAVNLLAQAAQFRGWIYAEQGDAAKAIQDFDLVIQLMPEATDPLLARGMTYASENKHQDAVADFTAAIELDPELADAYWERSKSYQQLGETTKAASDAAQAKELDPNIGR